MQNPNDLINTYINYLNQYNSTQDVNIRTQLQHALTDIAQRLRAIGYDINQIMQQQQQRAGQQQHYAGQPAQQQYAGQQQQYAGQQQQYAGQQQHYAGQPAQQHYAGQPVQQQDMYPSQQQARMTPPNQTPTGFGMPAHNEQPTGPQSPTRMRKNRVTTAQPPPSNPVQQSLATTQTPVVTEEVLPPRGIEHRLTPVVDDGLTAKLVNAGDELVYIYKGEPLMKDLKVVSINKSNTSIVSPPVPDMNPIGDSIYAELNSTSIEEDAAVCYGTYYATYTFYETTKPSFLTPKDDVAKNIDLLKTDVYSGNAVAIWFNIKLTNYVNAIFDEYLGTKTIIDSYVDDFKELCNMLRNESEPGYGKATVEVKRYIDTLIKTITTTDFDEVDDVPNTVTMYISETYLILDDIDILVTPSVAESLKESDSTPVGFTADSCPALYDALNEVYDKSASMLVYLLTDTTKYMLYKLNTCKGIMVKAVK